MTSPALLSFFDPSVYVSLVFLFGIAAQFRAMDGYTFLRSLVVGLERRLGLVYAVAIVTLVFSPFILNDVLVIILTPVVVRYARQNSLDAVPLVVAVTTFTNIASSLTPIGNPQNLLLWNATRIAFEAFVLGALPQVLASAGLVAVALLPLASSLGRARELPGPLPSPWPGVYLLMVVAASVASDLAGVRPFIALGVAFGAGFAFTRNSLRNVSKEYDFKAVLVLFGFVTGASIASYFFFGVLQPLASAAVTGAQPASGASIGLASNLVSNVPVAQLILNSTTVMASQVPRLAVELGLAGTLGPLSSFANILALQEARKGGVSVSKCIVLQLVVGAVAFAPALL